jgi:hypothetical protein
MTVGTLAGCSSKSDAPKVEPGAAAGKVLEVTGKVSVAGRALGVGDTVKTDDTIETGADGSVVIEIAHNNARWELGPNRKVKPTESQAWTADRAAGPAKPVEQVTSAAGRPAERSAADTAESARSDRAAEEQPAAASSRGMAPPAPTAAPAPPPPPGPSGGAAPGGGPGPATGGTIGGAAHAEVAPEPQPEPAKPKKPEAKSSVAASSSTRGGTNVADAFTTCVPKGTKVTLSVHIAHHVPSIKFLGDVDAKVKSCITAAAQKLELPIESGDIEKLEISR